MRHQVESTFQASLTLRTLTAAQRADALRAWHDIIQEKSDVLRAENAKDMAASAALTAALSGRLKLDAGKMQSVLAGIQDLEKMTDMVGSSVSRTELDKNLILDKVRVPLGVIAIVFESRPDVIPQILSLALKSGNAVVLKGGKEAAHSNHAFMKLVDELNQRCPFLPAHWARYYDTREEFQALLSFDDLISLVIPRGSNELVQSVMKATRIPVLGHADGVCHLYIHSSANLEMARRLAVDAKAQYPSACNSIETILIDRGVKERVLSTVLADLRRAGVKVRGDSDVVAADPSVELVKPAEWHHEYGDLTVAIKIVDDLHGAIDHINRFGSRHTDGIVCEDAAAAQLFRLRVDSACVMVNASTRFADGYRFGLGAEVGISTSKLHARGPVGVEGLLTTQFQLAGTGQLVSDYVGDNAKSFTHRALKS